MRHKKPLICLLLLLSIIFLFFGCSKSDAAVTSENADEITSEAASKETTRMGAKSILSETENSTIL